MSQYEPPRPYQQQPYQPYPPYPPHRPPPPPWEGPPPTAVRYARNLIYLTIGLSLVRLALLILTYDLPELPETLDARIPDNVSMAVFMAAAVIGAFSSAAIWLVATIFIMRAAPWARVVVAVLCGLDVSSLLWVLWGACSTTTRWTPGSSPMSQAACWSSRPPYCCGCRRRVASSTAAAIRHDTGPS